MTELRVVAEALCCRDPDAKCSQVAALQAMAGPPDFVAWAQAARAELAGLPGRPERPLLVSPRAVPSRGLGSQAGRAAMLHAVAHIEFNAINLALDAIWRFSGMPAEYYADWLGVAADEARHFLMVRARMRELGADYGDLAAHNGLWESCEKTAQDVMLRMALVPRVLEARGLDVTPGMIRRLREVGDPASIAVLEVILGEEVAHVAAGTRWFRWCCAQRGLDPDLEFPALLSQHGVMLRPPLNGPARRQAGFRTEELPPDLQAALQ